MLKNYVRIFVDTDGGIKADCLTYDETGKQINCEPITVDSKTVAGLIGAEEREEDVESKAPLKGKLPDDFPGKLALDEADPPIHTYAQLNKALADGVKIPGIGDATKTKILEALGASSEAE